MLPTAKQLVAAGIGSREAERFIGPLRETCGLYEIDTGPRIAAFVAQCGHESASFTAVRENLNYSADALMRTWPSRFTRATADLMARKPELIANHVYGGRLGNRNQGDGWRYIGRGLIQVTGLANYEAITELIHQRIPAVPDLTLNPEQLEAPQWAAISAGAYWDDNDLNDLADRGDMDRMTRKINGGLHGLADRKARYARALRVFGQ